MIEPGGGDDWFTVGCQLMGGGPLRRILCSVRDFKPAERPTGFMMPLIESGAEYRGQLIGSSFLSPTLSINAPQTFRNFVVSLLYVHKPLYGPARSSSPLSRTSTMSAPFRLAPLSSNWNRRESNDSTCDTNIERIADDVLMKIENFVEEAEQHLAKGEEDNEKNDHDFICRWITTFQTCLKQHEQAEENPSNSSQSQQR